MTSGDHDEEHGDAHALDVPPARVIVNVMERMFLLCVCLAAACGGPQIPEHNGYKSDHAKPWKKAKTLKFDDQNLAKAKGDLSYPDMRRAAWYDLELTQQSDLDINVESSHDDQAMGGEDFDFGFEVLDPGFRKLKRMDKEEGEGQGDDKKHAELKDLAPGHYWIHLYLQGRMDVADYTLRVVMKPAPPTVGKTDFPAQVAFVQALPMVPISDDTPKNYKPPQPAVVVKHTTTHHEAPPKKEPPPVQTLSARIIGVSVVAGGTQITVGRGTASGAQAGMKGKINGIPNGSFVLASCNERACTATVAATTDQIKGAGTVSLIP